MNIIELHNKAMEIADLADIKKAVGNTLEALHLYEEAFEYERKAAMGTYFNKEKEPNVSILLRSAASLALNCNNNREAEKLIALGLSGEPPFEIAEELRDLLETVNFLRHLELNNIQLSENEVQLVIAGKSVGYGFAEAEEVINRIDIFNDLTIRTFERKTGKPFRTKGAIPKEYKDYCKTYISPLRAASMAFTIRFGEPSSNILSGFGKFEEIIEDITKNIGLLNDNKIGDIKENIRDDSYFSNFMSLTKELAPDGDKIDLFGITSISGGVQQKTLLTSSKEAISEIIKINVLTTKEETENLPAVVSEEGILKAANANKNTVQILISNKKPITLKVPDGLNDIVKKYWDENVVVEYESSNKLLININQKD
ncbi:MAG: hypothetical protein RL662_450 [Bacteroidota bacterium]|jgi:tetratricopeptide (TPR) repeat protein